MLRRGFIFATKDDDDDGRHVSEQLVESTGRRAASRQRTEYQIEKAPSSRRSNAYSNQEQLKTSGRPIVGFFVLSVDVVSDNRQIDVDSCTDIGAERA